MKMPSIAAGKSSKAFKFFEDDNITESAMLDDERKYSEDWGSSAFDRGSSASVLSTRILDNNM
eukprot:CAMPEP_0114415858 /NCGR_PEP_ID=MMETSP0103-20121206/2127_1 /TAXON_ID=37642 ORGANISM="Paraphysomonas imperforata, Strain PA2" /NCGR_SAMPLE_ID=MMETSP0103 /ASSEMBLY_ACC=CAM_ASM_000201 /LENGTH=62 /DNA_ID=CAMNT_0001584057 /DNA_START=756 /DNA_END=944 /DNA_ORIENTATION=-